MTEFNLSEKIENTHFNEDIDMLKAKDVKEFIKLLKKELKRIYDIEGNIVIDKLAGEKLI